MRQLWNVLREVEWYAVAALVIALVALALAVFTPLVTVPIVLGIVAIVSAVLSLRT